MQIVIPKFNVKATLNRFWQAVRGTPVGALMTHEAQGPLAWDLCRQYRNPSVGEMIARELFAKPLRGAGSGWESRRNLPPVSDAVFVTSAANTVDFNIYDFWSVQIIGFCWQVAGTVTAMVMDFDLYPNTNHVGTVVDKLDTVNGVITSPSIVASQAIGKVLYKDLGDLLDLINVSPNQSIAANVTTTTTAGSGTPFVIGIPRAETFLNLATSFKSA